jgi:hypothetical protein
LETGWEPVVGFREFGSAGEGEDGTPYTYWGASSAWQRARRRSGIVGCTFKDLRAKALTDREEREDMKQARIMGSHSTEQQTADYVRAKGTKKTGATR